MSSWESGLVKVPRVVGAEEIRQHGSTAGPYRSSMDRKLSTDIGYKIMDSQSPMFVAAKAPADPSAEHYVMKKASCWKRQPASTIVNSYVTRDLLFKCIKILTLALFRSWLLFYATKLASDSLDPLIAAQLPFTSCYAADVSSRLSFLMVPVPPILALAGLGGSFFKIYKPKRPLTQTQESERNRVSLTTSASKAEALTPTLRSHRDKISKRIKRTWFLRLCECLVIFAIGVGLIAGCLFPILAVQQIDCWASDVPRMGSFAYLWLIFIHLDTASGVLMWYWCWGHMGCFHNFRERCRLHLDVSEPSHEQSHFFFYNVERRLRVELARAVRKGNYALARAKIDEMKGKFGQDCVRKLYTSPRMWLWKFALSTMNPVHIACARGDKQMLELLHREGFALDQMDKARRISVRISAIYLGIVSKFRWLMGHSHGRISNLSSVYDKSTVLTQTLYSPLHVAVGMDHLAIVRWLLDQGVDPNAMSLSSSKRRRVTPLFLARSDAVVSTLIFHGANHMLVAGKALTVFQQAISRQKEFDGIRQTLLLWGGDIALTPLHAAAAADDVKTIQRLLSKKVFVDTRGVVFDGWLRRTPLHWASIAGAANAARELIQSGANVDAQDVHGKTPLHWAVRNNRFATVEVLLQAGARPDIRCFAGDTAILFSASAERVEERIYRLLKEYGADVNACRGLTGEAAIHVAVQYGHAETALALVSSGADVMQTDRSGQRALDIAASLDFAFQLKKAAGARDVMISYTHSHAEFATKIRQSLEKAQITTWMDFMDPSGIGGGAVWREEIARGISGAAVVLAVISANYPQSEWCLKELALAKEQGKPIIAISCEDVVLTDEMQMYLYTRQLIAFQPAIVYAERDNPKHIQFQIDEEIFEEKFRLLLDGVKDEVEKHRNHTLKTLSGGSEENVWLSTMETANLLDDFAMTAAGGASIAGGIGGGALLYICHVDCHTKFVRRLCTMLRGRGYRVFLDTQATGATVFEKMPAIKDAILQSAGFLCILSKSTLQTELLSDQLAFAEDHGKPIFPILFSEEKVDLGKSYSLARSKFHHFWSDLGFTQSLDSLVSHLQSTLIPESGSGFVELADMDHNSPSNYDPARSLYIQGSTFYNQYSSYNP